MFEVAFREGETAGAAATKAWSQANPQPPPDTRWDTTDWIAHETWKARKDQVYSRELVRASKASMIRQRATLAIAGCAETQQIKEQMCEVAFREGVTAGAAAMEAWSKATQTVFLVIGHFLVHASCVSPTLILINVKPTLNTQSHPHTSTLTSVL
jgi:hypothetical protein